MTLSKKKPVIIVSSVLAVFLIVGAFFIYKLNYTVRGTHVTETIVFADAMQWNDILNYNYNGYNYTVTKNVLRNDQVGEKIAVAAWNGGGQMYNVYSVKGVCFDKQIAIKTKYGYLIANKAGKTNNIAIVTDSGNT